MIFIIATGGFADYIFPARQGSAVGVASSFGVAGTVVLIRRLGRRYEELSAAGGFYVVFFPKALAHGEGSAMRLV